MTEHVLTVDAAGTVQFIYDDELVELIGEGQSQTRRASTVEPVFGGWAADMSLLTGGCGPVLGPYLRRSEALAAEVAWIKANVLGGCNG